MYQIKCQRRDRVVKRSDKEGEKEEVLSKKFTTADTFLPDIMLIIETALQ